MATNGQPVAAVERKMSTTVTSKVIVHPNDTNCITNDSSTITPNLYSNVNSHATTTTTAIDSPIISSTTRIKPKSSSFLHRDYNRKPILARSQVSSDDFARQLVHDGLGKIIIVLLLKLLIIFSEITSVSIEVFSPRSFFCYSLIFFVLRFADPSLMTAEIFFLLLAINLIPNPFQFRKLVCNFYRRPLWSISFVVCCKVQFLIRKSMKAELTT